MVQALITHSLVEREQNCGVQGDSGDREREKAAVGSLHPLPALSSPLTLVIISPQSLPQKHT